jgi:hypothetical protein
MLILTHVVLFSYTPEYPFPYMTILLMIDLKDYLQRFPEGWSTCTHLFLVAFLESLHTKFIAHLCCMSLGTDLYVGRSVIMLSQECLFPFLSLLLSCFSLGPEAGKGQEVTD